MRTSSPPPPRPSCPLARKGSSRILLGNQALGLVVTNAVARFSHVGVRYHPGLNATLYFSYYHPLLSSSYIESRIITVVLRPCRPRHVPACRCRQSAFPCASGIVSYTMDAAGVYSCIEGGQSSCSKYVGVLRACPDPLLLSVMSILSFSCTELGVTCSSLSLLCCWWVVSLCVMWSAFCSIEASLPVCYSSISLIRFGVTLSLVPILLRFCDSNMCVKKMKRERQQTARQFLILVSLFSFSLSLPLLYMPVFRVIQLGLCLIVSVSSPLLLLLLSLLAFFFFQIFCNPLLKVLPVSTPTFGITSIVLSGDAVMLLVWFILSPLSLVSDFELYCDASSPSSSTAPSTFVIFFTLFVVKTLAIICMGFRICYPHPIHPACLQCVFVGRAINRKEAHHEEQEQRQKNNILG